MTTLIENYRGWEISFNTDKETFYASSDSFDSQQEKQSYAAIKKHIDDFIKDNIGFKPFFIEMFKYGTIETARVIGIRKDKRFVMERDGKTKEQISDWREKDWYLVNPFNVPVYVRMNELDKQIKALQALKDEEEKKIVKKTIAEIKPNYIV